MGVGLGGAEQGHNVLTGNFTASGSSASLGLGGAFNVSIWGTFAATIVLQRSFDGGTTWLPVTMDAYGAVASFTAPASMSVMEPEPGVLYRLNCTWTSGTAYYRLSQ